LCALFNHLTGLLHTIECRCAINTFVALEGGGSGNTGQEGNEVGQRHDRLRTSVERLITAG